MTPEEFYNNQDNKKPFTKLTGTGISDDLDNVFEIMSKYHAEMMGRYYNENNNKSLRDEFAMAAIQLLTNHTDDTTTVTNVPDKAYMIADSMIERRKKK